MSPLRSLSLFEEGQRSGSLQQKCGAKACSYAFQNARWLDWVERSRALELQFFTAHRRWRAQRGLEPSLGFPGIRYILLHSLAHALIRQFYSGCC